MGSGLSPSQYSDFFEAAEDAKIRIKVEVESNDMFRAVHLNGYRELDSVLVPKSEMGSFLRGAMGTAVLQRATLLLDDDSIPLDGLEPGQILVNHGHSFLEEF